MSLLVVPKVAEDSTAGELEGGAGMSYEAEPSGAEDEGGKSFFKVATEVSPDVFPPVNVKSGKVGVTVVEALESEFPKNRNLGIGAIVDRLAASRAAKSCLNWDISCGGVEVGIARVLPTEGGLSFLDLAEETDGFVLWACFDACQ